MPNLPSGTVTFLFTDIEGSTALWERDRVAMASAIARRLAILRTAIEEHGGVLFKTVGDAVQAAFPAAPDGVSAALDAQRSLLTESWTQTVESLRIRMALHTAAATPQAGDYLAPGLNRLSRLLAAGHGGQVLLSLATQDLARDALPAGASLRDLGEHPLRDLYRPERIFQLLHPDLPADFPPIRTLATRPNNLPLQPTPFLGREDQVARVVDLLCRDDVRLLTITGPGGVGKTRLALQAAADRLEDFPDGVRFVDLSSLTDPSLVPSAIATVLGVRSEGGDLVDRLTSVLSGQYLLLVLDNFERVIEAAQVVTELLANVPGLKVLATSRTPLHAYGEREYPLGPLPLPDPAHLPSVEELSQYEAVRLFIDRAQAVRPDFTVTNANAPAVAEICARLDGLPLAIELAAAFVKMLPPQALLKRLEKRLPLLRGGARTLPARQQTMRDAVAWSHDLLRPEDQLLFPRLAVFPGGCTLEAAEAVAGAAGSLDVFAGIASLIDKSLLRQEEGSESEPRFRMLETVREYGLERLEASGEGREMRQRLAAWYLALAEVAEPDLNARKHQSLWVARLDAEVSNLRSAIAWFLEAGDGASALRLLSATADYWSIRLYDYADVLRWLNAGLAAANALPRDRALALRILVLMESTLGNLDAAAAHAQQELDEAQKTGDLALVGAAHNDIGMIWEFYGDVDRAAAAYAESVEYVRQVAGREAWAAWARADLADKLVLRGELNSAIPMLDEAIADLRRIGDEMALAWVLGDRGFGALAQGDLPLAARFFAECIDVAQNIRYERIWLGAITGLAGVALAAGRVEQAARLLGAVEVAREGIGVSRVAFTLHADRVIGQIRAALDESTLTQAWSAGRLLNGEEAIAEARMLADELTAATREPTA